MSETVPSVSASTTTAFTTTAFTTTARVITWQRGSAVELRAGSTTAIVVPELGMLIASFVVDGTEFVARPGGLAAYRAGHTTAIPLLYPWANRLARASYRSAGSEVSLRGLPLHRDANGLPIHGTMTARPEWEITALGRAGLAAQFAFDAHPDLLASFPFAHELVVKVRVAPGRLRVITEVHASAGVTVPVAFGWHPYWRVPGARDSWRLALPAVSHLRLDRRGIPTGRVLEEPPTEAVFAGREFDDLYRRTGTRSIALTGRRRKLSVNFDAGYPYLQVYAPAAGEFCCLEPMTAPTNALVTGDHPVVGPGATFCAAFTATVSDARARP